MDFDGERSIPRRQFVRSAVAIGGSSALSACLARERPLLGSGDATATSSGTPDGQIAPRGDPDELPAAQHEWSQYLVLDVAGNTVPPQQQLILGLTYEGSSPPTAAEREQVAAAFDTLDRAFQWGTGGDVAATFHRGLLTLVGYAPRYFDAIGSEPDLVRPETVLEEVGEDPSKTDGFDAVVILTSDVGSVVLAAEQALLGAKETVNGVEVEGSLDGVFSVAERRTGFAGQGIPADKLDQEEIPERAPLSMGFKSGFTDSLPSEDGVKIRDGPFVGGTTLAMSRLRLELDRWYGDNDHADRVEKMFCPAHDPDEVGPVGTGLGDNSGATEEHAENVEAFAEEHGRVGHTQKVARARNDDFEPRILRRSEGFATDAPEHTGFNFTAVQRELDAFVEARKAMNVDEYDDDLPPDEHGIVDYMSTVNRGTYIVPPRRTRALPEW